MINKSLTYKYPVLGNAILNLIVDQVCKALAHGINAFNVFRTVITDLISVKPHIGKGSFHRCIWPGVVEGKKTND